MPESHRKHRDWSPHGMSQWALKQGPETQTCIEEIMAACNHPQQALRACQGILRLGETYGKERLEAACRRALHFKTIRYRSVESILKHRLDEQSLEPEQESNLPEDHDNVRGSDYYH